MSKCRFEYVGSKCENTCQIKELDKGESTVDKWTDNKGNKVIRAWHSIVSYHDYCFNPLKLMTGRKLPVTTSMFTKATILAITKARKEYLASNKMYQKLP